MGREDNGGGRRILTLTLLHVADLVREPMSRFFWDEAPGVLLLDAAKPLMM